MTERREQGQGSVYQRPDGIWAASVTLPPGPDGKRRRAVKTSKDEDKAWSLLRDLRRELLVEGDITTNAPTVAAWMEQYLTNAEKAGDLRASTLKSHRSYTKNYIVPAIGKMRIDQLTPAHVRKVHALAQDGDRSPTTALQAHNVLSGALKAAMYDGIIRENVAARTKRPKEAHFDAQVLTATQAMQLLGWATSQPWHLSRWSLALLAGLRQSEALGLTRGDIDLENRVITVNYQLQRIVVGMPHASLGARHVSGQYWLVPPKSKKGIRKVPMVDALALALEGRMAEMDREGHTFVVIGKQGGHIDHSRDRKRWVAALNAAGLPPVRLHDARHTTGTLLRAAGVEQRVIQVILGHNSAAMTEHYSHLGDREAIDAMARFGALLEQARQSLQIEGAAAD